MLHGKDIASESKVSENGSAIDRIVSRAEELNKKGIEWHHHMFFPNCIFNKHKGKFCIVFEDSKLGVIESISDKEPKEDLKRIEPLFYSQNK